MLRLARFDFDLPPGRGGEEVRAEAVRDGGLEVEDTREGLTLTRRRLLGNRGLLRLLVPKCLVLLTFHERSVRAVVRLDGLGLFLLVMMVGGVLAELLADRAKYPREYPPAFPCVLAAIYVIGIAVERARTKQILDRVLGGAGARAQAT